MAQSMRSSRQKSLHDEILCSYFERSSVTKYTQLYVFEIKRRCIEAQNRKVSNLFV